MGDNSGRHFGNFGLEGFLNCLFDTRFKLGEVALDDIIDFFPARGPLGRSLLNGLGDCVLGNAGDMHRRCRLFCIGVFLQWRKVGAA